MKNIVVGVAVVAAMLLSFGIAMAGVPCAGTSEIVASPACDSYCPKGDARTLTVTVTVRDCYGTPLEGIEVIVTPAQGTTNRCWCPGTSAVTCTTNANGVATAQFKKFGGYGSASDCYLRFQADAEGVLLGPSDPVVACSVDLTTDCQVTLADFSWFAGDYGTVRCRSDFDCSGTVALADFTRFAGHYGHLCQ
jgi:hypothetical protein